MPASNAATRIPSARRVPSDMFSAGKRQGLSSPADLSAELDGLLGANRLVLYAENARDHRLEVLRHLVQDPAAVVSSKLSHQRKPGFFHPAQGAGRDRDPAAPDPLRVEIVKPMRRSGSYTARNSVSPDSVTSASRSRSRTLPISTDDICTLPSSIDKELGRLVGQQRNDSTLLALNNERTIPLGSNLEGIEAARPSGSCKSRRIPK